MSIKRYKPEQIVTLLRQIEGGIANGKTTPQACRDAQITAQTYYRWRKESRRSAPSVQRCGNDAPWKARKTQNRSFHSFHRAWKSGRKRRIPTFPQRLRRLSTP